MDLAWTSPLHIESRVQLRQTYPPYLGGSVVHMLGSLEVESRLLENLRQCISVHMLWTMRLSVLMQSWLHAAAPSVLGLRWSELSRI